MSFRHNIADTVTELNLISYESPLGDFLGPPENLTGDVVNKGEDVILTWDPPESEVTVFGYELFLEGSLHAEVSETSYTFEGMVNGTQYDFNVRAIGPRDIKSPFSNTATFTGGGLPAMSPYVFGNEFKAGTIVWRDVQDNQYYTIEGYNVYATTGSSIDPNNDKINPALLSLDVNSYTYFNLGEDTSFKMGVSFEYDGGQESAIFTDTGTTRSEGGRLMFNAFQKWRGIYPLVAGSDPLIKSGVKVEVDTEITMNLSTISPRYWKQWTSPENFDYLWTLRGRPYDRNADVVKAFTDGCTGDDGFYLTRVFKLKPLTITIENSTDVVSTYISRGFWSDRDWNSMNFLWSGPTCPGQTINTSMSVKFSIPTDKIISTHSFNDDNFSFSVPIDEGDRRLTSSSNTGSLVLRWYQYRGVLKYELYIRSKGSSSWGTPVYSHRDSNGHPRYEPNLTSDIYEAKVRYITEEGSTYYSTESNIEEFEVA